MALENESSESDPYALIDQARELDFGTAERSDLLDRAITLADRAGNVGAQFVARMERMETALFSGEAELVLALFAWCQSKADERSDIIPPEVMLWRYKYVMTMLPRFAGVTLRQMDSVVAEMIRRFEAIGTSMRPVYHKRSELALYLGQIEQARALWDEAVRHPRDRYADCLACEISYSLNLLARQHRFDELLAAAEPILDGTTHCTEVPHVSLPLIMQAMSALGRKEEARKLRADSYRLIRSNPLFIEEVSLHVEFLVSERNFEQASTIALRHLPWLQVTRNEKMRFHYARALYCLLVAIAASPVRASMWLQQLLDGLEGVYGLSPQNATPADKLGLLNQRVASAGLALAVALDRRSGNEYFQRQWQADAFVIA